MKEAGQPRIQLSQSRARGWPSLGQARATAGPERFPALKNRAPQVADSARLPKCKFWQSNQRFALIAALLRGVWGKSEASGPKPAFPGTR